MNEDFSFLERRGLRNFDWISGKEYSLDKLMLIYNLSLIFFGIKIF